MPSTTILCLSGSTRSTRPVVPASSPVITITLSSLRIFMALTYSIRLDHFGGQADNFQEPAFAQLAGDGAENARPPGVLVFLVDDDHRVAVEPHIAAVIASR